MSRWKITETRTMVVDSKSFDDWMYDDEATAAGEYARDLPPTEWDTLETEVEEL